MDNALNEKLDLSALHLGIISVGALLGAVVTLVVCILAGLAGDPLPAQVQIKD